MKSIKKINFVTGLVFIAFTIMLAVSCKKKDSTTPAVTSPVFQSGTTMYGFTYADWTAAWWKWNLQFDCAHFPLKDTTGLLENQNQSGSVFFLSGRRGHTLSVTVPSGVSLFLPLITFESDYPCASDTSSHPAAGETVEHFLTTSTQGSVNAMDHLSLTIDGDSVMKISSYKILSPVFTMTANADLGNCYDDCIAGVKQSFVGGGYFIMLRPLSAGKHTIHRVGGASSLFPFLYDITYNITQL